MPIESPSQARLFLKLLPALLGTPTWDDRMTHKGRRDHGPGTIDVFENVLTFRVGVDEPDPFLGSEHTVLIWTDTKLKKVTDRAPNTESGDDCARPQVDSEVISVVLP